MEKFFHRVKNVMRRKHEHVTKPQQQAEDVYVDRAFQSLKTEVVEVPKASDVMEKPVLEVAHIDSAPMTEAEDTRPMIFNITGAWGRGPEVEGEAQVYSVAMGNRGLLMDMVSMQGHGLSGDLKGGWSGDRDFEKAAAALGEYLLDFKEKNPNRKIIINAWSMGGVTALKIAAQFPGLVDGLVLMDTPVFKQEFWNIAARFLGYATQGGISKEPLFNTETKFAGLGIFATRLRDRNKPEGMPLKEVVYKSGRSLTNQDLIEDETLAAFHERPTESVGLITDPDDETSETTTTTPAPKGPQMLLLYGSNDFVVRRPI